VTVRKGAPGTTGRATIGGAARKRLEFCNSRRIPDAVEVGGRRMNWVGIGGVDEGPASGNEVRVVDDEEEKPGAKKKVAKKARTKPREQSFQERIDYIMAERGWAERTVLACVTTMFETERDLGELFVQTLRELADEERAADKADE